jgi:hypothetical protein
LFREILKKGSVGFADFPNGLFTQSQDCQRFALSSSALILTQSFPNKREAFVWLFSFSPAYTSELVTLP